LEAWLREPENRAAFARMQELWTLLGTGERTRSEPPSRRRNLAMVALMCAASAAICVLSLGTNNGFWTALDWTSR
jgi:ferric-dicitrate binding protein FerR (iron transport regulator)